jgi:hypothetical protein
MCDLIGNKNIRNVCVCVCVCARVCEYLLALSQDAFVGETFM